MTIIKDGVNANKIATDFKREELTVGNNDKIPAKMAKGGGWVAVLEPIK